MQGASDGGVVVDEGMWLRTAPACRLPVWAVEEMDHSNKKCVVWWVPGDTISVGHP